MGKRIIQRARGHVGPVYRVRKKAFVYEIRYPNIKGFSGESEIIELVHSRAHSAPLARMRIHLKEGENKGGTIMFYAPAFEGAFVGQKIAFNIEGRKSAGDIVRAENMEMGDKVYNIERIPGDGGKIMRSEGFQSVMPLAADRLEIHNYLNSSPVSSTFPFVSFDLTSNKGILYGVNSHNNSLILFDRFSLPNANS